VGIPLDGAKARLTPRWADEGVRHSDFRARIGVARMSFENATPIPRGVEPRFRYDFPTNPAM
jgi:hypothetical protein